MSLKEPFIHSDGLDGANALVRHELFYPVDQEHGVTVRKHRHHPADVIIAVIVPRHAD